MSKPMVLSKKPEARKSNEHSAPVLAGDAATIQSLIADFGDSDGIVRRKAREALVTVGQAAVKPLTDALSDPSEFVRWEAAKALAEIGSPSATEAMVKSLEDDSFGVRWLAAEGLIALGRAAIEPLMLALMQGSSSPWLREGAHHVLHDLAKQGLRREVAPVIAALEGPEPDMGVPEAAVVVLARLGRAKRSAKSSEG